MELFAARGFDDLEREKQMTDQETRSAKDLLVELSELAKKIHEYQIQNPPTYYFVRASNDADPEWRDSMIEKGWVRRVEVDRMCLAWWDKMFFNSIGVIPDAYFPEDKDGKRIEMLGVSQANDDAPFSVIGGIERRKSRKP